VDRFGRDSNPAAEFLEESVDLGEVFVDRGDK
jgi:hypothetical protein